VSGLLANQTANIQADILIHLLVLTIHQWSSIHHNSNHIFSALACSNTCAVYSV